MATNTEFLVCVSAFGEIDVSRKAKVPQRYIRLRIKIYIQVDTGVHLRRNWRFLIATSCLPALKRKNLDVLFCALLS